MKIVQLRAENVKRLKAVTITPTGDLVVIGGNNGNGKTSVLDSIMYAIGGKSAIPSKPIREGEKAAEIEVDLGELKVVRRFTESGSTVKVLSKDGASFGSPQKMLDELVGRLSFDPMDFLRMKPVEQSKTLCDLVGIDTGAIDAERRGVFEERTAVNRMVKDAVARLAGMAKHEGVPAEEVSVTEAADAYNRVVRENDFRDKCARDVADTERAIADLERALEAKRKVLDSLKSEAERAGPKVDTEPLRQQMEQAESINRKVRENAAYVRQAAEVERSKQQAADLTAKIEAIDDRRATMIRQAEYPIEGLGIGEDGSVLFNGIPFDQCSSAEQTRVSVAMGLAMNPRLKVLLIRDGSLLDENSMRMVAEMAQTADAQVWIERVGKGSECEVIIEDGMVESAEEAGS